MRLIANSRPGSVAAMTVSVALEVASVAGTAAAAALAADGAGAEAVLVADRLAWYLGAGVLAPGGLAVLLVVVAMWRGRDLPRALAAVGVVVGAVMLASGLLFGSPATYAIGNALSVGVLAWWLWVVWAGVVLVRRGRRG